MPPKKIRYTTSLATSWVSLPLSRPESSNGSEPAKNDTPEKPQDHDTTKSSSSSRSKYTNTIPSSWIVPLSFKEQSKQADATKGQNKPNMLVKETDWAVVERLPQAPPAPTDELFPHHRAGYAERHGTTLQNQPREQKQITRSKPITQSTTLKAASNQPSTTSPGSQTILSTTSASGSCDLRAAVPPVSPSYSVV